jgi:hypothetical protein
VVTLYLLIVCLWCYQHMRTAFIKLFERHSFSSCLIFYMLQCYQCYYVPIIIVLLYVINLLFIRSRVVLIVVQNYEINSISLGLECFDFIIYSLFYSMKIKLSIRVSFSLSAKYINTFY